MKPIDNPDTTNTDPAYWDDVLRSHGLSMERGIPRMRANGSKIDRLLYIGSSQEIEDVATAIRNKWLKEQAEGKDVDNDGDSRGGSEQ